MTSTVDAVSWGEFPAPCGSVPSTEFGLNLASAIGTITAYGSEGFIRPAWRVISETDVGFVPCGPLIRPTGTFSPLGYGIHTFKIAYG
ncbi:hypothetical protein, partial [Rhizobium sp. L43]|uniref:hypothetical protein n=1 Tax=Rhizobium sp. L43 TaxID=2035452 RepID=UPI001AEFBB63